MDYRAATLTRSSTSTCTKSRVDAVLTIALGDIAAFVAKGLLSREQAVGWINDLTDVALLEAVERFQVKLRLPDGTFYGLDYQVSDDGSIASKGTAGGFSVHWIPAGTSVTLVVKWRDRAPKLEEARRLLRGRGWGPASILEAKGEPDRGYAKDGYGVYRRTVGEWPR